MLEVSQSQRSIKSQKRIRLTWWRKWWRAWSVFHLLMWTIWVIYRERQRVVKARTRGNYEVQPNIEVLINVLVAFRQTAIKLGVLMIKLGQFLSSRADLLPEQALSVLSSLQDEVPPESFDHVVSVIESELGKPVEEIFSVLERKCTAAASLGQVHKAVLVATGETVAVKIQRPNIDELVRMDLSTLKFVIWIINRFVDTNNFIDLMAFYREFKRITYQEIDFVTEATNAQRFRAMFKDDPTIYVPRIYDQYVSKRVLVLEWINGIKINDYTTLDANHFDRLEIANRTVQAYFHQFFDEGFFHADPHPGNIFVKQGSAPDNPIIAFVDFGMVGTLTNSMKKSMRDIFTAIVTRDSRKMVSALTQLGFIGEGANVAAIERALGLMLEQYFGMTLGEMRHLDIPEVGREIENLLYGQPFQIPAQFAFTGRAVSTLVGVSTGLAPNFNFIDVATPYARQFLGLNAEGIEQTLQELLQQVLENGRILLQLPRSVQSLINKLDTGQLEVRLANLPGNSRRGASRRGRRRGNSGIPMEQGGGSKLSLAFVFTISLAAGVFLMTSPHLLIPGWFCLGMSALFALVMLVRR